MQDALYIIAVSILNGLSPAQRAAAEDLEGPVLILAGAGSGKTRTLTHRAAWILHQDKAPAERILVVTFTNKAARELRERLQGLIGDKESSKIWAMTFHALCLRMLRQSGPAVGLPNDFTVLDMADSRKLIQEAAKEIDDPAGENAADLRKVRALISRAKNSGQNPEALSGPLGVRAREIWKIYQRRCQEMAAVDFDDLLLKARDMLRTEQGQATWASRFSYVMVDEYQDVNGVQEDLLRELCSINPNLCVVGDDAQSVYGFRAAEVEHILSFQERWPGSRIYKLEDNYRSSAAVLEAAQAVIERSRQRYDKKLIATRPRGNPVRVLRFENHWDEASFVGDRIRQLLTDGVQPEEIAVAYRTNAQSQAIEEALSQRSIDYQVVGGVSFMKRSEIQNARAWLAILSNRRDRLALERATSFPRRGVGPGTIKQIMERAEGEDLLAATSQMLQEGVLKGKAASGMKGFLTVIKAAEKKLDGPLEELLQEVLIKSGIVATLKEDKQQGAERLANLDGLKELAERYSGPAKDSVADWLADTALDERSDQQVPGVKLMTLHATKGLEFRYVFLTGLEEELFLRGDVNSKQLEEERRLLYVGMTRAEHELVMSLADMRRLWGREIHTQPLQFLFDLPPSVIHQRAQSSSPDKPSRPLKPTRTNKHRQQPDKKPLSSSLDYSQPAGISAGEFSSGNMVRHPIYGLGQVSSVNEKTIQVSFMGRTRSFQLELVRLKPA